MKHVLLLIALLGILPTSVDARRTLGQCLETPSTSTASPLALRSQHVFRLEEDLYYNVKKLVEEGMQEAFRKPDLTLFLPEAEGQASVLKVERQESDHSKNGIRVEEATLEEGVYCLKLFFQKERLSGLLSFSVNEKNLTEMGTKTFAQWVTYHKTGWLTQEDVDRKIADLERAFAC